MLWKRSFLLSFLLCFSICFGQTQLSPGDISIIGIDCESEDFMFVTFVPMEAGTEVYFTDEEANGSYQIGLGEGTVLYTVPNGGLSRGEVVSYSSNSAEFTTTSDGTIILANSGDGLIAYQGGAVGEVDVFLDALGIDTSSMGSFPSGFTGRVLGVANGQYQGARIGLNQASYLVRINDINEWNVSSANVFPFDIGSFSFDATPLLFSSKNKIFDLGYDFDENSSESEFIIEGVNISNAVMVSITENFEISFETEGPYSSNLIVSPSSGSLPKTKMYVRLKENLKFGHYSDRITISSIGVNSLEIDLQGDSRMGFVAYCNDLFISEYIEGTSNNKFIEIFNPTVGEIELEGNYQLEIYSNGNISPSSSINLVGRIPSNGVFVIEHPSESLGVQADQQSGSINFNGNDAIVLKKGSAIIDLVGQVGVDPGIAWSGPGCIAGTKDGGLIRKSFITEGTKAAFGEFKIDEQWRCTSQNDISNLGFHSIDNPSKLTIWNGSNWDLGIPDENDTVLIFGDYSTTLYGELTACMMYIAKGVNVEVEGVNPIVLYGDAQVKGNLQVSTHGTFVQTKDQSNFKIINYGMAQLSKQTSPLNNWYEYTYWSSPVNSIAIETALSVAPTNRRFYYEAANFVDVLAEVDNSGVYNPGSDGIDDDGDDWQLASGIMTPGVGYAATMSPTGFAPGAYAIQFSGEFNNGVLTTPVVANSGGAYSDWNLLGNPYPGGLDASMFLTENNTLISSAIYLWSHNTAPSSTASGNEGQNFSNSDYAIITGSGVNIAGGDGIIPESFVPSGQGFFVEAKNSGDVLFKNSMRAFNSVSNSQFFKSTKKSKKNKDPAVWLNLTTDSGAFSQIAIGFFEKATNDDDGFFFDVPRRKNTNAKAVLYSQMKEGSVRYSIQGRSMDDFSNMEPILLGVESRIDINTTFQISIVRKQGSMSKGKPIYLYDKETKKFHNLNKAVFEFSMDKNIENKRFELRFSKKKDKKDQFENLIDEFVSIRENSVGQVQYRVDSELHIARVEIFDVLGRQLYKLENVHSETWFDISKVQKGVYFSRIILKNNHVLFKKAIKRN